MKCENKGCRINRAWGCAWEIEELCADFISADDVSDSAPAAGWVCGNCQHRAKHMCPVEHDVPRSETTCVHKPNDLNHLEEIGSTTKFSTK